MIQQQTKQCTACGAWKPCEAFSRMSSSRDGLRPRCRACIAEADARYYAENRAKRIANAAAWHKAHPEQQRAAVKRWAKAHPEYVRAACRRWYQRHGEEYRERKRQAYRERKGRAA